MNASCVWHSTTMRAATWLILKGRNIRPTCKFTYIYGLQGCQLLRFGRSLLRFLSLTTPENTPSKSSAEKKFWPEIPIPWRNGECAETTGTPCTLAPPRFSEISSRHDRGRHFRCIWSIDFVNLSRIYAKIDLNSFIQVNFYTRDWQKQWLHEAWRLESWNIGCNDK